MTDDHEIWPDEEDEAVPPPDDKSDDHALLSDEQFDDELARLETHPPEDYEPVDDGPYDEEYDDTEERESDGDLDDEPETLSEEERLRAPRAHAFRRRLRTQISTLPLALFLLALGVFLIARDQDVSDLPDLSTPELIGIGVLVTAATMIIHALLLGRRARGLLFFGLWVWLLAGMLAVLVYGIDDQPDAAEWWPVLVWSLGLTLLITYLLERTHDVRLVLLSVVILVAGSVAYWITSARASDQLLDNAADYWPLLLSVMGVVLLPLAFRRRIG